jgi:hypothetical protein
MDRLGSHVTKRYRPAITGSDGIFADYTCGEGNQSDQVDGNQRQRPQAVHNGEEAHGARHGSPRIARYQAYPCGSDEIFADHRECALCLKGSTLRSSHLLAAGFYRLTMDTSATGAKRNPILMRDTHVMALVQIGSCDDFGRGRCVDPEY